MIEYIDLICSWKIIHIFHDSYLYTGASLISDQIGFIQFDLIRNLRMVSIANIFKVVCITRDFGVKLPNVAILSSSCENSQKYLFVLKVVFIL